MLGRYREAPMNTTLDTMSHTPCSFYSSRKQWSGGTALPTFTFFPGGGRSKEMGGKAEHGMYRARVLEEMWVLQVPYVGRNSRKELPGANV